MSDAPIRTKRDDVERRARYLDAFADKTTLYAHLDRANAKNAAATLRALLDERDALQDRLEMRHVWKIVDGYPVKVPVEPGSVPDGIDCRDYTIRGQGEEIMRLTAEYEDARAEVERLRDVVAVLLSVMPVLPAAAKQIVGMEDRYTAAIEQARAALAKEQTDG